MVWKKVNNADVGTATKFGGNDMDKISDAFSAIDVDDFDINCDFTVRDDKFKIRNPANTFNYIFSSNAIVADRTVSLPLLTGADQLTCDTNTTTLSNKTLDSTNTISSSSSLPATVVKTDATNSMGDFDTSFKDNRLRIWNPADTFRYTLIGAAISANRNLTLPLTSVNDTLAALGTVQAWTAAQTFNDSLLKLRNPADSFSYTIVPSAIVANRNLTLPLLTGNDTAVAEAHTQTLTNKTIEPKDNVIPERNWTVKCIKIGSTYYAIKWEGTVISSSSTAETVVQAAIDEQGVIFFPNTHVDGGGDNTDWIFSGGFAGFTINNNTRIVAEDHMVRWVVPQGFTGVALTITGPDPDETVQIRGLCIKEAGTPAKDWTGIKIQMDSATDYMYFSTFQDIYILNCNIGIELETTNAAAFINSCAFENITIWHPEAAGILFDMIASGDIAGNLFKHVNIQTDSGTLVGFKNVDGFRNTFINCYCWDSVVTTTEMNIASTAANIMIVGGNIGEQGAFIDQGKNTYYMVGCNEGKRSSFLTNPDLAKYGTFYGSGLASTGEGIFNGRISELVVGTGSSSSVTDTTGTYKVFDTGATTNSLNGVYTSNAVRVGTRSNNIYFKGGVRLANNTNMRVFCGLVNSNAAAASAADPLNALEGIGLWLDTGVSANWKRYHNDSSGAGTVDDTSVSASTGVLYPVEIYAMNDAKFRFIFNGTSTDISTNIPASGTVLGMRYYIENLTGASRVLRCYYIIVRTDI